MQGQIEYQVYTSGAFDVDDGGASLLENGRQERRQGSDWSESWVPVMYHVTSSRAASSLLHSSSAGRSWKQVLQLEKEVVRDGEYLCSPSTRLSTIAGWLRLLTPILASHLIKLLHVAPPKRSLIYAARWCPGITGQIPSDVWYRLTHSCGMLWHSRNVPCRGCRFVVESRRPEAHEGTCILPEWTVASIIRPTSDLEQTS